MKLSRLALLVFSIALLLWIASPIAFRFVFNDWMTSGQFADTYGAINALFSGLALGGVVLAIFMQREELQLQREELAATRAERHRTAEAQEESVVALTEQVRAVREQGDILLTTARLNAMSALVNFHSSHSAYSAPASGARYAERIEALLSDLDAGR